MRRIVVLVLIVIAVAFLADRLFLRQRGAVYNPPITRGIKSATTTTMILTSSAFEDNTSIPAKFTCDGWDVNPELHIQYVPDGTKSLALLVEDPDSPQPNFLHWLVWNINPKTEFIKEESKPPFSGEAINGFGNPGYGGPCPHQGEHHYVFRLFALDTMLPQGQSFTREEFLKAISSHVLEESRIVGLYKRK